ncbi:MAG: hypothetical protein SNH27_12090, partial [Rikenellaceae bacterium]
LSFKMIAIIKAVLERSVYNNYLRPPACHAGALPNGSEMHPRNKLTVDSRYNNVIKAELFSYRLIL